jgi:hypothetical protein
MVKRLSNSELEKEVERLLEEVDKLQIENTKLELVCKENGILEEIKEISDTEAICVAQIKRLREKSLTANFSETDAKILDILHKNLRQCRGEKTEKSNARYTKKMSNEELLKLVKDE